MTEQNHDITLRESGDECRGMDTVLNDTVMIQQNASEHGYVRRIVQLCRKRNKQEYLSNKKPPSLCCLCGEMRYCRDCRYGDRICNACGEGEGSIEAECRGNTKVQPMKTEVLTGDSVSVTLMTNDEEVKVQLDAASDTTLISRKTWRALDCQVPKLTNNVSRKASGDALKLEVNYCKMSRDKLTWLGLSGSRVVGRIEVTEADHSPLSRKIIRH
ncbi:unnamed protein product [Hymenolepis diminuta]|uniref:Peptidase A2 domain-containing protein n=1 Tax=Hymenolepis diminuta TaxID=6216 RepID=A0A564YXW6_HYMDI|nr:unnamed protein product [Hymenolepis diminuta]